MSSMERKIECLAYLMRESDNFDRLIASLNHRRLLTEQQREVISNSHDPMVVSRILLEALRLGEANRVLSMLTFDWQRLPVEKASVTIVFGDEVEVYEAASV